MKKNLILSLVFAFALVAFAVPVSVSAEHAGQGLEEHCSDHNGHPGKVEVAESPKTINVDGEDVTVTITGQNVAFTDSNSDPIVVEFCIKAGPLAGGKQTGSSGSVTWVNHGGQTPNISYVVVYSIVEPEEPEEPETPVTPETPRTPVTPTSTDVDEEEAPQVEATPAAGGVNAGSGNATTIATAAVALIGSLASLAYGVVRFTKFGA